MIARQSIAILVPQKSNRLAYTIDWIFKERMGLAYTIITDARQLKDGQLLLGYGQEAPYKIPNLGFLFESNIEQKEIMVGTWLNYPTLFHEFASSRYSLPFDLFSAVFYLLSRYEEYLPYTPDQHQRYPADLSILTKLKCLEHPIVDQWLLALSEDLERLGLRCNRPSFEYQASFDIDIAWSFLHKGWRRNVGGFIRDLAHGRWGNVVDRLKVTALKNNDPFDSYDFIKQCHQCDKNQPLFFVLAALQNSRFDKQILPSSVFMQRLICCIEQWAYVGIHPSYYSNEQPKLLPQEKATVQKIIGRSVIHSRQHYIKVLLPTTYQMLIEQGIEYDYSMGYSTHLGFRAGTGASFFWYDLKSEQITPLRIHPFCFMDATAHYELQLDPNTAFERLKTMTEHLRSCHSTLSFVFHNFSLGTEPEWKGWGDAYRGFVEYLKEINHSSSYGLIGQSN